MTGITLVNEAPKNKEVGRGGINNPRNIVTVINKTSCFVGWV